MGAHGGHVTVVAISDTLVPGQSLLLTGAQDGILRVWDARAATAVAAMPLHNHRERGAGAIGSIACGEACGRIVTFAADWSSAVVDPRAGWLAQHVVGLPDFVYSSHLAEGEEGDAIVICGCGDGSIIAFDPVIGGEPIWSVHAGASAGAARGVAFDSGFLVSAWDDGNIRLWTQ